MQTLPKTEDRSKYSPPYIGWCWLTERAFTIQDWRYHPIRQRFALIVCPFCSEVSLGAEEHTIELLEARDDL